MSRPIFIGASICSLLCVITLFCVSSRFLDASIIPKWLGLIFSVAILSVIWILCANKLHTKNSTILYLFISCLVFVFIRNWMTNGFSPMQYIYLLGLLYLFLLLQQMVIKCPPRYLYSVIILFALLLSVQGILQYAGVISSGSKSFDAAKIMINNNIRKYFNDFFSGKYARYVIIYQLNYPSDFSEWTHQLISKMAE